MGRESNKMFSCEKSARNWVYNHCPQEFRWKARELITKLDYPTSVAQFVEQLGLESNNPHDGRLTPEMEFQNPEELLRWAQQQFTISSAERKEIIRIAGSTPFPLTVTEIFRMTSENLLFRAGRTTESDK